MEPETEIDYDTLMVKYNEWAKDQSDIAAQNKYLDSLVQHMISEQQKQVTSSMTNAINTANAQDYQKEIDALMKELSQNVNESVKAEEVFSGEERDKISDLKHLAHQHFYGFFNGNPAPLTKENVVIAGGAFVSWASNQNPKDIDCFVLNTKLSAVLRDYLKTLKFKAKDLEYLKGTNAGARKVQEVWEGQAPLKGVRDLVTYQFIFTEAKTREELLADFDYKHCMVSYHNDKLYISRAIYDAIKMKHLIVNNPDVVTQWREEKYKNKGYIDPNGDKGETLGDILTRAIKNAAQTPHSQDPWAIKNVGAGGGTTNSGLVPVTWQKSR